MKALSYGVTGVLMKKTGKIAIFFLLFSTIFTNPRTPQIIDHSLNNGLKILVQPSKNTPDVSIQMYYNVGSKDEKQSEKGLAHLLEHMIFKGTQKLSEVDITLATDKLSGWCNANTSCDRTQELQMD